MKRVRIDFAAPSLRRTLFHTTPLAWTLLGAGLCLALALAWQGERYLAEERAFEAELAAQARRAPVVPAVQRAARAPAVSAAQANAVNAAIAQLNLPWRDLAAALADATPASIALLALEPDAKRRTLRISAEARNSDDMLAYITRLQAEEWFTSVVLMRHEVMQEDPNRPLRFQVSVQWGTP